MSALLNRVKKLEDMVVNASKQYAFHVMTKEKMRESLLNDDTNTFDYSLHHVIMYI